MTDDALLALLYRRRPSTVAAVAELARMDIETARSVVDRYRERGVMTGRGNDVLYVHPAIWASANVTQQSDAIRRSTTEALSGLEALVSALPGLLRDWGEGETSGDLVEVFTSEGPHAEDMWFDIVSHDKDTLETVLPNIDRFLTSGPDRVSRFTEALAGKKGVRVIISSSAAVDPAARERLELYSCAGVQFRVMHEPPSWFYVDGDFVGLPFRWGESRPTSILALQNSALASMTRDYFDRLWRNAAPLAAVEFPWTSLMMLMRQGLTLEIASRALGIAPRTGRRRVAAAMVHYRTTTLFGLGVAFGADIAGHRVDTALTRGGQ